MEIFDIVDAGGAPTGQTVTRSEAHAKGIRHRTAQIWVFREWEGRPQVLLQKRSRDKDSWPGCLDTSAAGHIDAGEEPLPSALRELEEELGIRARPEELLPLGLYRHRSEEVFYGKPFIDDEVSFVYLYREPVELVRLRPQPGEVEAVGWYGLQETIDAVVSGDPRYCLRPEGIGMVKEWWMGSGGSAPQW